MRFFFLAFALTVSFAAAFDGSLRTTKSWTWNGGGVLTKKLCNVGKLKHATTCITGDANAHKGSPGLVSKFSVSDGEWVSVDVYRNHRCADGFIALSPKGTRPVFKWGPQKSRISLQENCGTVYIYGRKKSTLVARVTKGKWYTLRLRVTPSKTFAEVKEGAKFLGKKSHSEGFSGKLTVSIGSDQDTRGQFTQFTNFKTGQRCVGTHLERSECHAKKAAQHAKKSGHHKSQLGKHASNAKSNTKKKVQNIKDKKKFLKLAKDARAKAKEHRQKSKQHAKKAQAAFKEYEKQKGHAKTQTIKAESWAKKNDEYNRKAGKHSKLALKYEKAAKESWKLFKHHLKQAKLHAKKSADHSAKELHHLGEHYMGY